ncbi:MAG: CIA30 family protein [Rhodothermales bacterium]
MQSIVVFDFAKDADLSNWRVVNDGVMGGRSSSTFELNSAGHGVFSGTVSLENNGGFSSVQYRFNRMQVAENRKVKIRLKGDGKQYQFRVKSDARTYYSYMTVFETSGAWETIELSLADMYPAFRGRMLNQPNFSDDAIEELRFLIGNKKAEDFRLEIDQIVLE